jgi:two-component sensor histidine kinase
MTRAQIGERIHPEDRWRVAVEHEATIGTAAGRAGLGSRIIPSLSAQLAAEIHVDSTPGVGTVVTLRMPLRQQGMTDPSGSVRPLSRDV